MPSLGWIHFSPEFRDRVNTILDMMDEEGMVDELGVGIFRDAFADIFFPGISTIQTRAKYFFIVPYIMKDYLNLSPQRRIGLGDYLYESEHDIMWNLAAKYHNDRNSHSGVIGITKIYPDRIARRPSSIYWNGIRMFGFIRTSLSLSEYIIRVDETLENKIARTVSSRLGESDDLDVDISEGHGIKISTYRNGWKDDIDLPLDYDEADFLRNRILKSVPGSLLSTILYDNNLRKLFFSCPNFETFARSSIKILSDEKLKGDIIFAHDLNEVVKGIHLIYSNEINILHYQDDRYFWRWEKWRDGLKLLDPANLSAERLLEITPNAGYHTREFIREVLRLIRVTDLDYKSLAELVRNQEQNVKKKKSRFRQGAEIDFRKGESRSLSFMNYRYGNAKTIVNDIYEGLKC